MKRRNAQLGLLVIATAIAAPGAQAAFFFGPSPYLSAADSPFAGEPFAYFHLENFEDGALNTPGVTASDGTVASPSNVTDSVDADDGSLDGSGNAGHTLFHDEEIGITFTFDADALGGLPTHAGLVWTDGTTFVDPNDATFEAFDADGVSLGTLIGFDLGDENFLGGTAEDRFFGVTHAQGLGAISITGPAASVRKIEIDHLQYGRVVIPTPSSLLIGVTAGPVLLLRRRRG